MRDPTVWDLASAPFFGVKMAVDEPTKSRIGPLDGLHERLLQRIGGFPESVLLGDDTQFDLEARRRLSRRFLVGAKAQWPAAEFLR